MKPIVYITAGLMVRFTREWAELSQEQLSALVQIPLSTLQAIENEKLPLSFRRAKKFAKAMKCDWSALLFVPRKASTEQEHKMSRDDDGRIVFSILTKTSD
jgi:ribosome-binding protein aMBF1 (putative translation factor)